MLSFPLLVTDSVPSFVTHHVPSETGGLSSAYLSMLTKDTPKYIRKILQSLDMGSARIWSPQFDLKIENHYFLNWVMCSPDIVLRDM